MIVILGNGISGVTAARHIRKKSSEPILIVSSETKYFFSRTALMYVYMGHMKFEHTQPYEPHFWEKNNIELKQARIVSLNSDKKELKTASGQSISYNKLILATGSKPNKFGWKNQDAVGVQGLYSKQDLDSMEVNTKGIKNAVVIGGGLIGIEIAEMLLSRGITVDFLVRESHFWGSVLPKQDSELIMNHFEKHDGLTIHYNTELDEILTVPFQSNSNNTKTTQNSIDDFLVNSNSNEKVNGILTKNGKIIDCQFVGLAVGVSPNVDFLKESKLEINRGIVVNEFLETSVPDIYAIGDCAEFRNPISGRRPLEQVWYTGRIMGETVSETITGNRTDYTPGNWFNSAKFFDIEYQTYGWVRNKLEEGQSEFVYQPNEDILLHFVFETKSRKFVGINNFGIRLRHLVFDNWLNSEATIEEVLKDFQSANFDPEFYKKHEKFIVEQFNAQEGGNLVLNKKKWWQTLVS